MLEWNMRIFYVKTPRHLYLHTLNNKQTNKQTNKQVMLEWNMRIFYVKTPRHLYLHTLNNKQTNKQTNNTSKYIRIGTATAYRPISSPAMKIIAIARNNKTCGQDDTWKIKLQPHPHCQQRTVSIDSGPTENPRNLAWSFKITMYSHSFSLLLHFLGPQTPKDKVALYIGHMGGGKVTFPFSTWPGYKDTVG